MKYFLFFTILIFHLFAVAQIDSLKIYRPSGPDYSKTAFPKDDGLTYNPYVGETIAGFTLAGGWRRDTVNGGYNKEIYDNPYVSSVRFDKQMGDELIAYRYDKGKLFNGNIQDTFTISFTPNKIRGYLYGKPYYESKDLTVIFRAKCVDGVVQGKGVLCGLVPQYGIYNNIPISECYFENGEIVGICKHWDLNSIDCTINNGKIKSHEAEHDYFELRKLFEVTEITYIKGSSEWTRQSTTERKGKIETKYQNVTPKKKK